jgi:osmoprotectant transport system substrate-binding protein
MRMSRARALGVLAAAAALPACARFGSNVRVGSKNFTESILIAEVYAQALEAQGFRVDRRLNLGSTQIALAAIQRGDIDVYPEYTGTALIDVLHMTPPADPKTVYAIVKDGFSQRYGLLWLKPSPMNDSQGLATTVAVAKRSNLSTLSQLSRLAPQLRLATIQEFLARPDGLPGLQKAYGGFHFKEVRTYDIGLKYEALLEGRADVATAFTTDGAIVANNLILLEDDKRFWTAYNVAPVLRAAFAQAQPRAVTTLAAVSPLITDAAARHMNYAVEHDKADPSDVVSAFLRNAAH